MAAVLDTLSIWQHTLIFAIRRRSMIHNLLGTSSTPGDDHFSPDLVDLLVLSNLVEDLLIEGFPVGYIFDPSFSRS